MCFSAEVSFIASAVLGVTGYATLRAASIAAYRWIALVPLLFALQQFSEGVLWLNMPVTNNSPWYALAAENAFMLFAYLFWPIYLPFALYMAEANRTRRTIIGAFIIAGIAMVSIFIWNFFTWDIDPVDVSIVGDSLRFNADDPRWRALYVTIISIPCFISTLRWMKLFGVLVVASVIFTEMFFNAVFVSVWCFFAAIMSLTLFFILKQNQYPKDTISKD